MTNKNWLLAAAFLFVLSGAARADIEPPTFQPQLPVYKPLDPNTLYAVSITCVPIGNDLAPISEKSGLFTIKKYTTTHAIFVSTKTASQLADNTAKLPDGALGMALVYVTDGDKGTEIDNRMACDQTFLVKQTDTLFLIPALNFSETVTPGPFFAALDPIMKIVGPLTSVFLGTPIPADIINKVSTIQQTGDPFGKLLALFNKNHSFARSYKLSVGTSSIDTQFSRVTIVVKPITAIVDVPKYLAELKKQIDGAPQKLPATGIRDACTDVAKQLGNAGFVSPKDQAFAVAYAALRAYNDKNNILECLGEKKSAQLALDLGDLLWRGVPDQIKITQADVDNILGPPPIEVANQPPFDNKMRRFMDLLMVRMGQYAKNTPPLPDAGKALPTLVSSTIVVSDLTQSTSLLQGGVPGGLPAFLDGLMAKGFYHFGCFSQNADSTGKYANDTNVLFLAFKAKPDENKTGIQNTLAMFPVFNAGLLSALVASDNIDWIRFVLAHRDQAFDCNGFQVDDK